MKPDLQEGARLLAEATERPWETEFRFQEGDHPANWVLRSESIETMAELGDAESARRDAALIVWLVNNAEALLAIAREREELDDRRKAALTWLDSSATQEALNVVQARRILREFAALHQQAKDEEGRG